MTKGFNVSILGDGRIAQAVAYFLRKYSINAQPSGLNANLRKCDLLIGALAGELGEACLGTALKYKKNLIDISDVDPPFYLKRKKEIAKAGLTVIPGCGFSPGLVNFILGHELANKRNAARVVVKAGSLCKKENYFPFLWCFEDLVLEHRIPSYQMTAGKKKKFPAFAGYKNESFFGIDSESYFCASGFENILDKYGVKNFETRVVRPQGYREFFRFLDNQGLLRKENFYATKKILESNTRDNITLAEVEIKYSAKKITWLLKSVSQSKETLNSMQKITASVPAVMARLLLEGNVPRSGLVFMEELGEDKSFFASLISKIKKEGISLKRKISG